MVLKSLSGNCTDRGDIRQCQTMDVKLQSYFDSLVRTIPEKGIKFSFARDLQDPLGYLRWENFMTVIRQAIASRQTIGYDPNNHFRASRKWSGWQCSTKH